MLSKKKGAVKWSEEAEKAFQDAKHMCMQDVLLTYPDLNQEFIIYVDASDYAMGGTITQDKKGIVYWSKKLTKAQVNYMTQGKEMLAATSLIKEFSQLLKGAVMTVLTDHKNNTWLTTELESACIHRQCLYLDEMGVKLE